VFVRSFQETEKKDHPTVLAALEEEDSEWYTRDLVIMPSHLHREDVSQMVTAAHHHGFDAIVAAVLREDNERNHYGECWAEAWDERWNIPNPSREGGWEAQTEALGRDLWTWICEAFRS